MVPTLTQAKTTPSTLDAVTHFHLDPIGGLSGDMFLGTALDTFPELADELINAMRTAGLPEDWQVTLVPAKDHAMTGSRLKIEPPAVGKSRPTGTFLDIKAMLEDSDLPETVTARAIHIFTFLAEAEAKVHGMPIDKVHFHEIADWDSVADIVGAAFFIEQFPGSSWSVAALPLGGGRVQTSHGPLPVPAPATAELLKGFPVLDDGVSGERVTPTGAAILKSLAPSTNLPAGRFSLHATGQGFGTKSFPGLANMLRLLAYTTVEQGAENKEEQGMTHERIGVIRFEVDDQSPEDLAVGLDSLRAMPEVRDVCQWSAFGKKGRVSSSVQVLCEDKAVERVAQACFSQTTTIGLRCRTENRFVLSREERTVSHGEVALSVKEVVRPEGRRSRKVAVDDLSGNAQTQLERAELRRVVESAAESRENGD